MKTSILLGLLLATAVGARAQQSPTVAPTQPLPAQQQAPATDAWGTKAEPTKDASTGATTDPAPADAAVAPSGIDAALEAESPKTAATKPAFKPITSQPKLNPNSSGTYDKKIVKRQNKHTDKVVTKRRRATSRYADFRRADQINGIRRMEKGKIATASAKR